MGAGIRHKYGPKFELTVQLTNRRGRLMRVNILKKRPDDVSICYGHRIGNLTKFLSQTDLPKVQSEAGVSGARSRSTSRNAATTRVAPLHFERCLRCRGSSTPCCHRI